MPPSLPFPIPPGIRHVALQLPRLALPPLSVFLLTRPLALHPALLALLIALSYPVALALEIHVGRLRMAQKAKSLGASIPPQVEYSLPGGMDLVRKMGEQREGGFFGAGWFAWYEQYGPTYKIHVGFKDRVRSRTT